MFIPIGDVNIYKAIKPFLAYGLIAINVVIFILQFLMPEQQQNVFVNTYGAVPNEILHAQDMFTLITNMFLHGGWMHLIGNMAFLWIFADNIEATVGYFKFILFYIVGGIVATLTHVFLNIGSPIPSIGASGAIAAVLGAYLVMFPTSKVRVFVMFLFSSFNVPSVLFLGVWFAMQFSSLWANVAGDNVAYWAHIGGFVFGLVCGFLFRPKAIEVMRNESIH